MTLAPLAVSLGDPAGIGPEVLLAAWSARREEHLAPFFVVGGKQLLNQAAQALNLNVPIIAINQPEDALSVYTQGLPVLGNQDCAWNPSQPDTPGAELALESLRTAAALTYTGQASALVTGPISKAELAKIGFTQPGQTEFVADACSIAHESAVMMLAGPSLRTVPLTIHVPLAQVPGLLTTNMITAKARIVAKALIRDFGLSQPRLAITGLNPHAGEQGRMGDEDAAIIAPAIAALQAEGIAASGPHPADALFAAHSRKTFDVALCMYHDQALIPIKTLDFDQGVNVTLGLPIVRTSPDHGTAFGIAGKGTAHPGAMIAAIRMAGECAQRRAKTIA